MTIDMKHQPQAERREAIARAGLASLKAVASIGGPPSERALAVMRSVRDFLMKVDVDLDALQPIAAAELATAVPETEWRERILRGMTVLAMMDGEPTPDRLAFLEATAATLGIQALPVRTFRDVLDKRFALVRIDLARRSFIRHAAKGYVANEGVRGILDTVAGALGREDKATAARYHQLDDYPEGTFGRAYADFIRRNGFSYPGELGGPPPPVMRHDCCHVLGGYGTTPQEECAVVAFQAGFEKADPFYILLFALAQFELGVGASPFLPGTKSQADPETVFAGLEHGTHVERDLIGDPSWDPWDHFHEPIAEVRAAAGIPPRGREPVYPEAVERAA
ncbi:MAG: TerB family tellurite resistance protein [Deltaproteobacteria bacterium]|nr:TerB family tellurite resistance protein [Deltaproteobacteria bacterium]